MDMTKFLNNEIAAVQPSVIRNFFELAAKIEGCVSLGIGEPDFSTPMSFCDAGYESMKAGKTGYSPNAGIMPLRVAIAEYLKGKIGVEYAPENQIVVTVGGSEAIDIVFRGIINAGDEVLIPEPAFVSYEPCVTLAGGVAVAVPTTMEEGFKPTAEKLEQFITEKTKAIVMNYPNNPTGVVMSQDELDEIAKVLVKHNILAISDEIYADLVYGTDHASIAASPDMKDLTLLISGVSKSFAMTGWRIGYLCGHADLIAGIYKVHQFSLSCASTTGQYVALEGFLNGDAEVAKMVAEYDKRRKFIVKRFEEIGLPMFTPEGAFYAFPCIKSTGLTSGEFCERLLVEEKVACVPGYAFGAAGEGFIRCSYATSMENIEKACDGIERFVAQFK